MRSQEHDSAQWDAFVSAVQLYCSEQPKQIHEFIQRNYTNRVICEKAIEYLVGISGSVDDEKTPLVISIMAMIADRCAPKDEHRLVQFVHQRALEIERLFSESPIANNRQIGNAYATAYMLLALLKSFRSGEALALMQEIYESNKEEEIGLVAKIWLELMKNSMKRSVNGIDK